MNRRIFANLILYDIRKGFRENKIKWIVGVFIFVFFSFITVSDFSVNSPELGFLAYFTNILQGMPPYIKTDDSVFTIPVSWFLFYALAIKNYNRAGYICSYMGDLYELDDRYVLAAKKYKESGRYFRLAGNMKSYVRSFVNEGRSYMDVDSNYLALTILKRAEVIIRLTL